ncbi:NAD(+)/NADH kinase [Rhabdothermincola sp.]|jgi:NAD+ kinase|uniref:NAD(+)/NADH kinase n=1 Tax=Rhabdothermincola sp. TaxID=2820405 RepID=UPI002FDFF9B8
MATIAFVVHHDRPDAAELARDTAAWLEQEGHEVRLTDEDAAVAGLDPTGHGPEEILSGLDAAVSLGGDGTMLRTVAMVAASEVPVIGVNLGQLGYLTEVEPAGLRHALARFLRGDYAIEQRMLLAVHLDASSGSVTATEAIALNDAVLEKTPGGHTVRLDVEIDGRFFTPYTTDGLIVATPTGSTAYALSVRGPIVEPTHRAILLTPVSPHMLFDRTLVLQPDTRIRITVAGTRPATLSVDGRGLGELAVGDSVTCTASDHVARLVVFGPRDFHGILKAKFKLGDR